MDDAEWAMKALRKERIKRWSWGLLILLLAWVTGADEFPLGQYDAKDECSCPKCAKRAREYKPQRAPEYKPQRVVEVEVWWV